MSNYTKSQTIWSKEALESLAQQDMKERATIHNSNVVALLNEANNGRNDNEPRFSVGDADAFLNSSISDRANTRIDKAVKNSLKKKKEKSKRRDEAHLTAVEQLQKDYGVETNRVIDYQAINADVTENIQDLTSILVSPFERLQLSIAETLGTFKIAGTGFILGIGVVVILFGGTIFFMAVTD